MNPEPFAWAYQNANTEHQYLVWHKQEGGRNWIPLFTLTDVQEAILAEREACAKVCDRLAALIPLNGSHHALQIEAITDCAAAIRARSNT